MKSVVWKQQSKTQKFHDFLIIHYRQKLSRIIFECAKRLILLRIILEQYSQVLWTLRDYAHATYWFLKEKKSIPGQTKKIKFLFSGAPRRISKFLSVVYQIYHDKNYNPNQPLSFHFLLPLFLDFFSGGSCSSTDFFHSSFNRRYSSSETSLSFHLNLWTSIPWRINLHYPLRISLYWELPTFHYHRTLVVATMDYQEP